MATCARPRIARILATAILTPTLLGCAPEPSGSAAGAIDALRAPMRALNEALVEDGGPKSISAGRAVLAVYDELQKEVLP
jgi:hypothetical protein